MARSLLVVLVVVLTALSWRWTWANGFLSRPPLSDSAGYRNTSLMLLRTWREDGVAAWGRHVMELGGAHPPAITALTSACARVRGHDEITLDDMWLVSAAFGVLSTLGSFALARRFLSPGLAVAAAAVAQSAPVIIDDWWRLYTQLPMTACVLWAYAAVLGSEGFTRRGPSLAFGLWAGAAWMLKSIAPVYLVGAAAALVVGWRRNGPRRPLVNSGIAVLAVCAVAMPWYGSHLDAVLGYADSVVGTEGQRTFSMGVPLWSLERWLYYPIHMAGHGLAGPLAALTLAALAWGAVRAFRGTTSANALVMTTTLLVAWIILTVGQTQTRAWYVMGFVPPLAILLVSFAASLRSRRARVVAGIILAAACAFNHWLTQRPIAEDASRRILWDSVEAIPCTHGIYSILAPAIGARSVPEAEPWPHREWVERMVAESTRRRPAVFFTVHAPYRHPLVNPTTFDYESLRLTGRRLDAVDEYESGFFALPLAARARRLAGIEFIVHDHRKMPLDDLVLALKHVRLAAEVLDTRTCTEKSTLSLLRIRPDHVPPRFVDEASVATLDLTPAPVAWRGGVRLVASDVRESAGGGRSVILLLDASGDRRSLEAVVSARRGDKRIGRCIRRVPLRRDGGLVTLDFALEGGPAAAMEVALRDVSGDRHHVVDVAETDLVRRGFGVELPSDD